MPGLQAGGLGKTPCPPGRAAHAVRLGRKKGRVDEPFRPLEQFVQDPGEVGRGQTLQKVAGDHHVPLALGPFVVRSETEALDPDPGRQRAGRRVAGCRGDEEGGADAQFGDEAPGVGGQSGCRIGRRGVVRANAAGEVRARALLVEHLKALRVGLALQVVPDVGERVRMVGVVAGEGLPGLLVEGRVVQALRQPLDVFLVAGVPVRVEPPPKALDRGRLVDELVLALGRRRTAVPKLAHADAVDEHDRGVLRRDGEIAVVAHVEIEEKRRIGEVDLIHVVVDRLARKARELRDGVAVVGEARPPAAPVEARDVLHQMDLVDARRVADLLDRVEEDPLGPVLRLLGAEVDPYRRLCRGLRPQPCREDDPVGVLAGEWPAVGRVRHRRSLRSLLAADGPGHPRRQNAPAG